MDVSYRPFCWEQFSSQLLILLNTLKQIHNTPFSKFFPLLSDVKIKVRFDQKSLETN